MFGSGRKNLDYKLLLENLKDLDKLSQKAIKEYNQKNEILKGGLNECLHCSMYLDNSKINNKK